MIPQPTPWNTSDRDNLLEAVTARALTTFPQATARIARGKALVEADAVTDWSHVTPATWHVSSAAGTGEAYTVVSTREATTCTCPDYARHAALPGFFCKHGWAVLLTKALRREMSRATQAAWRAEKRAARLAARQAVTPAPLRHAYHMQSGEEGHVRLLGADRAEFFPGGRKFSFVCMQDELCIGPCVPSTGRPD
jgi:hypothetical protein